jgi:hypothetical protein
MTALTHDPSPLFASAEACEHIEPPEPEFPDGDGGQWAAWSADHPYVTEDGRREGRFCLDTQAGKFCTACTEDAHEEHDLPTGEYVAAADCTHVPVTL